MSNLLATKLHRPNLPPRHVERPRLTARLTAGLDAGHNLTLLSAPAGFGKSICAIEWLDDLKLPIAWLSLDSADDEPGRFFTYLLGALQSVVPALGNEIESVLRAGQLPPVEVITASLIDGLLAWPERFVLVLDDFHHIQERSILQVFERLLVNQPTSLHMVLLTREDPPLPLARLRAHNQLTELRAADLAFTSPEIDRFLSDVLGLSLSEADRAVLGQRTEGWIAGLQLAGLSLRDRPDPSRFIANLSGSNRFILNYLTEEVLIQQPGDIQQFLLQTALLDRLNGDLCNAVTGRTDSHTLLENLYNANLFLIALDDEGHWYRYHHLFAGLLGERHKELLPEHRDELHRRTSQWYAGAAAQRAHLHPNERAAFAGDAIQHALAASDYASALQLIETYAIEMLRQWYARPVREWLNALPPEWSAQSLRANFAFVWMHLMRGDFSQAAPYIERLFQALSASASEPAEPALQAEWLALQSTLLNAQGKPQEGLAVAKQALDIAPNADAYVRAQIHLGLASAYQQMDRVQEAVDAYHMIIQHGRTAGNISIELLGVSALALMTLERGQLHQTFELVSQGIQRIEDSGELPPISMAIYGELGQIYYHWRQFEQAEKSIKRSTQVGALTGFKDADLFYGIFRSRLYLMQGDLEGAAREFRAVLTQGQSTAPVVVAEEVLSQQVRLDLAFGNLAAAEAVLKSRGFIKEGAFWIPDLLTGHSGPHRPDELTTISLHGQISASAGTLYTTALRVWLYRAHNRGELSSLAHAIELSGALIAALQRRGYLPLVIDTLLLRAQMHAAAGNHTASRKEILLALELGEPEGFITIFLENGSFVADALGTLSEDQTGVRSGYVRKILSAFAESSPPREQPVQHQMQRSALPESLTGRELEVLRLMAEGMTYAEIAGSLVVSLNTVRTHVKSIYGKLGVDNRTRAIEIAHQHHIL